MADYTQEKKQLREFLTRRGVKYSKKRNMWQCPNPAHADENPSATLYEKQPIPRLYCPICHNSEEKAWSVIDVCGLMDGLTEFKDVIKSVRSTLSITNPVNTAPAPTPAAAKKPPKKNPLPFPAEQFKTINEEIVKIAAKKTWGKNVASWKYYDTDNNVIALDVRFEGGEKKKEVITFWYDGKLKWYGAPVFIYNRHLAEKYPEWPIVIHEGSKCADIGMEKLCDNFIHLSWSGGANKAQLADWSVLKEHEVFILPDDDRQVYGEKHEKSGQLKPQHEQPGYKAAKNIQKQISHAKIIKPVTAARDIKPDGADIEEILQVLSPQELTDYILSPDNIESPGVEPSESPPSAPSETTLLVDGPPPVDNSDGSTSGDLLPFRILGIGDDDRAAFITTEGRFKKYSLDSLSKQKLLVIASREFWCAEYKNPDGKVSWDMAADEMIRISQARDFDESTVRGRGAWRDGDNFIYHDGVKTYGNYDKSSIYLRLPRVDIGINDEPVNRDLPPKIKNAVMKMSFETPADVVRCLSWSILAPFSGALKYRPAMLLTGPSGAGKSVIQSLFITKLSKCLWVDATESSVAGVRGRVQKDSIGIFFEEADKDTEKKKNNVTNIYSLMRANYTDDAPDTLKGTADGKYVNYKMNSMFGFASIDPTVDSIADENRIFRVNVVKPTNGKIWKALEIELMQYFTDKNCRGIRALTWQKLDTILKLSDRIVDRIKDLTGRDHRSSFADAMLAAAFMVVWAGNDCPTDIQIDNMLEKYYSYQAPEEHRDEAEEIIDRVMSEMIEILHTNGREKLTIMECLNRIYTGRIKYTSAESVTVPEDYINDYRLHIARYGVRICDGSNVAIVNNHHLISKIIDRGPGYNKIIARHPGLIEISRNVNFYNGKSPRCTILKGILKKKHEDMTADEQLGELF